MFRENRHGFPESPIVVWLRFVHVQALKEQTGLKIACNHIVLVLHTARFTHIVTKSI